jgi:leucyl aminopeptidase (aminopeptidase T)|uniref:Aminopeptidase n=1 Tax=candidate division WOR-3 bacterium TaxID=2052148 RepID=A0A7V3KMV0_UNCW3
MCEYFYEFELGKAAKILCEELFKLKPGETFVITADTESDKRVVDATARAAFACDAKPMVIYTASPLGVGKSADPMLPLEALTAALLKADAWVEFNNKWLLYSTPYDIAIEENKKLRHLCLVGMNVDMMVRCIGRVDYPNLERFEKLFAEKILFAKHVRITTPAGTDIEFNINKPDFEKLERFTESVDTPGSHMLAGQIGRRIGLALNYESINGTIVFDGSLVPPIVGILREPVRLTIKRGEIIKVDGGKEAIEYEKWLKSFNHPQMLRLAHVCYGFNPGARLTGNILEDERVWGATEWGVGNYPGFPAPSHSDGVCLNSSTWLDGIQIMDRGQLLDPELKKLAKKLGI